LDNLTLKNKAFIILSSFLLLIPLFFSFTAIQGKGEDENPPFRIQAAGDMLWSFVTGGNIWTCPAIDDSGNVYFGANDGRLYSLQSNGTFRWSFDASEATYNIWMNSSPTIDSSGNIYFGVIKRDAVPNNYPSRFFSLDSSGNFRWSYLASEPIWSSPAIDDSGNLIFGNNNNRLFSFSSAGSFNWSFNAGSDIRPHPSIAYDGTIYFGTSGDEFFALNSNGTFKWSFVAPSKTEGSTAIDASGNVYFALDDAGAWPNVFSFDSSGNFRWSYQTNNDFEEGPAIDGSGNIYIGCQNSRLYSFSSDGTFRWSYAFSDSIEFSTPAIGNDGLIYVGSNTDRLYCFNSSGVLQWSTFDTNGNVAHPAIANNGNIYVGAFTRFFAFDSNSSNIGDSPWPKEGHDMQNTQNQSQPTLVELAFFRGKYIPPQSKIIVEWKTETELETYGFYLLRKEGEKGSFFAVNSYIIIAQGDSMTGADYSYEDFNVRKGTTYYYLLEEIDLYGASNHYGPISVSTKESPRRDRERLSEDKKYKQ
jgi:outer membrane protein assembly factor BamB